jgi:hypothetical protein
MTTRIAGARRQRCGSGQPFDVVAARTIGSRRVSSGVWPRFSVARHARLVVFFAPVSSGSAHDPLPTGHWNHGISWHPVFHCNPELFWMPAARQQSILPANPVSVAWIGATW